MEIEKTGQHETLRNEWYMIIQSIIDYRSQFTILFYITSVINKCINNIYI